MASLPYDGERDLAAVHTTIVAVAAAITWIGFLARAYFVHRVQDQPFGWYLLMARQLIAFSYSGVMGHGQWEKQCIKVTGDLGTEALSGLLNAHQKFVTFEL
ncbi:hypothetical protein MTO96_023831 [Rhipicephalus appendiculatus]